MRVSVVKEHRKGEIYKLINKFFKIGLRYHQIEAEILQLKNNVTKNISV